MRAGIKSVLVKCDQGNLIAGVGTTKYYGRGFLLDRSKLHLFDQPLSPNREGGWGFLTEKQVKNRLSNHLGIIVFVTDRQAGTFSERNR